jgi:hypothetical protein
MNHTEPSISETAFCCPHCSAFTTQYWHKLRANQLSEDHPAPHIADQRDIDFYEKEDNLPEDLRRSFIEEVEQIQTGLVLLKEAKSEYSKFSVSNLHLSKCYNCKKNSVWVHKNLIFPARKSGVQANQDLPDEIVRDFEEARSIVSNSPRGAAALLRLCVQKLCIHLGGSGKNIDQDIAKMVKEGLNPLVQKSLDIVRVVGNESVHPGTIDLNDDRDTAIRLFELVNAITDQMITHPKKVDDMYSKLPEAKRKAIERRDSK